MCKLASQCSGLQVAKDKQKSAVGDECVECKTPMQAGERTLLEQWEASWIAQCSSHFDSTAILCQILAERCVGINPQSTYLSHKHVTCIFVVTFLRTGRAGLAPSQVFNAIIDFLNCFSPLKYALCLVVEVWGPTTPLSVCLSSWTKHWQRNKRESTLAA